MSERGLQTKESGNKRIPAIPTGVTEKNDSGVRTVFMGFLCLISIIAIFIIEGLLAWKIINIRHEQLALQGAHAILAQDRAKFEELKRQDRHHSEQRFKLIEEISKLNDVVTDLEKQRETLQAEKVEAKMVIESSLAALTIEKRFQTTIDRMETVLEQNIKKLANIGTPVALLARHAQDLEEIVSTLTDVRRKIQADLNQAAKEMDLVTTATSKTAVALKVNMQNIIEFIQSTKTSLEQISGTIHGAAQKVHKHETGLDNEIKAMTRQTDRFLSQIIVLDTRLNEIKTSYQTFSKATSSLDMTAIALNDSAEKLRLFARTAENNYRQWVQNKDVASKVILEMGSKSTAVKNASDTLLLEANHLKEVGNQLTQDTADFNNQLEQFKLSMTEETVKQYKAKIAKISSKIQSDSDTIYNLNFDVERELRKLLVELENLNHSIKSMQSRVKQSIKPLH
jgi:chromosome segregation ATPase